MDCLTFADEPPKTISNSIGMQLVALPIGEFEMGSPEDEVGRDSNEPQHTVKIVQPFLIGKYEVTQAEYLKLRGKNPSHFTKEYVFSIQTNSRSNKCHGRCCNVL